MKSNITARLKKTMGLVIVAGEYVDRYGRVLETYVDADGVEDLRPTGRVCRNMAAFNRARSATK
jgi:hypothetical protein